MYAREEQICLKRQANNLVTPTSRYKAQTEGDYYVAKCSQASITFRKVSWNSPKFLKQMPILHFLPSYALPLLSSR